MATFTDHRLQISVSAEDCVRTARSRAPAQVGVVLDKTAGDEELVFLADLCVKGEVGMKEGEVRWGKQLNLWLSEETQYSCLVNYDRAMRGRALDALTAPLTHYHHLQVRVPAFLTEIVATLQSTHGLRRFRRHYMVSNPSVNIR